MISRRCFAFANRSNVQLWLSREGHSIGASYLKQRLWQHCSKITCIKIVLPSWYTTIKYLSNVQYLRYHTAVRWHTHKWPNADSPIEVERCDSRRRFLMLVDGWRRRRSGSEGVEDVTRRCRCDQVTHVPRDVTITCTVTSRFYTLSI